MSLKDELFHAGVYDPVKRRQQYLRTRQLKGRQGMGGDLSPPSNSRVSGTSNAQMRPSRQKELLAQKAALEKRLDVLRDVLAQKVKAAKARSGAAPSSAEKKEAADKAAKAKGGKDGAPDKPLTAAEKAKKRKDSAEQYEKEKGMSLSKEVQELQEQIKDIRTRIEEAIADSRKKTSTSTIKTAGKSR